MSFGAASFGDQAWAEQAHVVADNTDFAEFLARVSAPRCWLLEIDALSLAVTDALAGGFSGAGFDDVAFGGDSAGSTGGVQTLRYSTHGWTRRDYGYAEYLSLPGVAGNYASTPDSAAVSVIGDIDVRVKVAAVDWTPGVISELVSKSTSDSSQFSYLLRLTTTGILQLYWSENGTTLLNVISTAVVSAANGAIKWVRVTMDVDNGAGGKTTRFYTSDDGETWTQLGLTVTSAGTTSIFDSTATLRLGARSPTGQSPLAGKIYYAEIRNGIDGTIVAKFDPRTDARPGDTSFTSSTTAEVWTINQSGSTPARLVAGGEAAYYYDGRVAEDFTIERSIVGRDGAGIGGLSRVFAEIPLVNTDGGLDALLREYALDGRAVRLLVGDEGADYDTFGTVFAGVIESAAVTERQFRLRCTDGYSKLALPIQDTLYAGSGGNEGGADLAGKPKPLCYGVVRNITPPLVDAVNLIYQVHDGVITDVTAVRDRGVALVKVVGAPAAGEYQVIAADGTFKLGATPDGEVTCDVQGDTPTAGYSAHTGVIVQRLLADRLATSEIDTTAFANHFSALAGNVGIWIGTEVRMTAEVLDELLAGVGAFGGFTRQGVFTIGRVAAASGAPVLTLDETDIIAVEREPLPAAIEPLAWRVRLGWGRNYTVQNDVAALTADADRLFAAEPQRVVSDGDAAIKSQHLLARDYGPLPSLYDLEADAQTEVERLFDLWGTRRGQYRVTTVVKGMLADIGEVAQLSYPRFQLHNGAAARVISQSIRGSTVELRVIV